MLRINSRLLLEEVSNWKLEAAEENSERYFFHIKEVNGLEDGENSIVIGRKGTGKTAICRYFENNIQYNRFTIKLSFKEFPFNLLYSLEDRAYTVPSQYISLWKYFIYNAVLQMMASNAAIDAQFKHNINLLYDGNEGTYVGSVMSKWIKRSFGVGILGISGSYSADEEKKPLEEIWPELIPAMEKLILNYADSSKYFVVFDELDEDYRNYWDVDQRDRYIALVTSLFKAVSNVRRIFVDHGCDIRPIVFLRDDIYELLSDPDKNKWEDYKIDLSWSKDNIKRMLAFRIARSIDQDASDYSFNQEWEHLFQCKTMPIGTNQAKKRIHSFDFIMDLTHSRPRDFVRFLRDGARLANTQGHRRITEDTMRGVDVEFSYHLRQELINEIGGILPDITHILAYLGASHKQRYNYNGFMEYLDSYQQTEECDDVTRNMRPDGIAKILFHFSIVGNAPRRHYNRPIFRYQRTHLSLNSKEPVVVHRGLLRALGLH